MFYKYGVYVIVYFDVLSSMRSSPTYINKFQWILDEIKSFHSRQNAFKSIPYTIPGLNMLR